MRAGGTGDGQGRERERQVSLSCIKQRQVSRRQLCSTDRFNRRPSTRSVFGSRGWKSLLGRERGGRRAPRAFSHDPGATRTNEPDAEFTKGSAQSSQRRCNHTASTRRDSQISSRSGHDIGQKGDRTYRSRRRPERVHPDRERSCRERTEADEDSLETLEEREEKAAARDGGESTSSLDVIHPCASRVALDCSI